MTSQGALGLVLLEAESNTSWTIGNWQGVGLTAAAFLVGIAILIWVFRDRGGSGKSDR